MSDNEVTPPLLSDVASQVLKALYGKHKLSKPDAWVRDVERRAIFHFVSEMSARYETHSANSVREDMIAACAWYDIPPAWFFEDSKDEIAERELRADVAHYKIMNEME